MSHLIVVQSLIYTAKSLMDQEIRDLQAANAPASEINRMTSLKHVLEQIPALFGATTPNEAAKYSAFALRHIRDAAGIADTVVVLDSTVEPTADELATAEKIIKAVKPVLK